MSPHCVWIITVGGFVDKTLVTNPNIAMLTELGQSVVYTYDDVLSNTCILNIMFYVR